MCGRRDQGGGILHGRIPGRDHRLADPQHQFLQQPAARLRELHHRVPAARNRLLRTRPRAPAAGRVAQGAAQSPAVQHGLLREQAAGGDHERRHPAPIEQDASTTGGQSFPARHGSCAARPQIAHMSAACASVLRVVVGLYWLYFACQTWHGLGWVQRVMKASAQSNPIPGLHEFLVGVVVPNWFLFAVGQTIGETPLAVLLILGFATRWAAILGVLLALNLASTVAFGLNDDGFRWMYYLAVIVNAQVIASGAGRYAVASFKWVPAYLHLPRRSSWSWWHFSRAPSAS